jgi:hypothetical protein
MMMSSELIFSAIFVRAFISVFSSSREKGEMLVVGLTVARHEGLAEGYIFA